MQMTSTSIIVKCIISNNIDNLIEYCGGVPRRLLNSVDFGGF